MRKPFAAMLAVATVWALGLEAQAEVPYLIPVVGVLTDTDEAPLDGDYTVVFTLYTDETGGMTLWGETQEVEFTDGLFRVYLGSMSLDGMDITDFVDNDEVWLGVRVGADSEMNRVRMASVPWAFEAETCGQVTDLTAAGIQGSIGADACATGFAMRGWTGSAAVCVALPDTSGLVADSDIGVTVQAPIDQAGFPCNYGIQQIAANGSVVCANQDVVTQCGPEAGLGSNDNYLGSDGACHIAAHSCTADQYLAGGATGICQPAPHSCAADQFLDGDGTCQAAPQSCTADQYLDGSGTCQEAPHSCGVNQYIDGSGACQTAPHSCAAGQYLDGNGTCVAMAVSGTANRLAMFSGTTTVGNSIITQSGTTGINVGGSVGINVAPTASLHVSGTVKMMADPVSRNVNTIYTEGSDGFLSVNCNAATGEACIVQIFADATANPSNLRGYLVYSGPMNNSTVIPIRQNWNWRIQNMGNGDVGVSWMELGL